MRRHATPAPLGAISFAILLLLANQLGMTAVLASGGGGSGSLSPYDSNMDGLVDGADLAPVLSNWNTEFGSGDFNGDCMVDSADLGLLLSAWGPVSPPQPAPISWENKPVSICLGPGVGTIEATISGQYSPGSGLRGQPCFGFGQFDVTLQGSVVNQVSVSPTGIVGFGFDCKIAMSESQAFGEVSIDGIDRPVSDLYDGMAADFDEHGPLVLDWDCYTQMMASMVVVMTTPEMLAAVEAPCGEPSWACSIFAYTAAIAIGTVLGAGCVTFAAGCAIGTVKTLGGLTLQCATWIALCGAFTAGGFQGAYNLAIDYCPF